MNDSREEFEQNSAYNCHVVVVTFPDRKFGCHLFFVQNLSLSISRTLVRNPACIVSQILRADDFSYCQNSLKSVHFKKTVMQFSFLSKVLPIFL